MGFFDGLTSALGLGPQGSISGIVGDFTDQVSVDGFGNTVGDLVGTQLAQVTLNDVSHVVMATPPPLQVSSPPKNIPVTVKKAAIPIGMIVALVGLYYFAKGKK